MTSQFSNKKYLQKVSVLKIHLVNDFHFFIKLYIKKFQSKKRNAVLFSQNESSVNSQIEAIQPAENSQLEVNRGTEYVHEPSGTFQERRSNDHSDSSDSRSETSEIINTENETDENENEESMEPEFLTQSKVVLSII